MMPDDTPGIRVPLSYQEKLKIDLAVKAARPNIALAYLLCILLGVFGAHRFYLGATDSARIMLILGLTVIGLAITVVWAIYDLFNIPRMIAERVEQVRARLTEAALAKQD